MNLKTHLISGAGNTFHLVFLEPARLGELSHQQMRSIAVDVCSKVKADGFIFLTTHENATPEMEKEFSWQFFNNDGSDAEMCGNATRCVGYFVENILKNINKNWLLSTIAGPIRISTEGGSKYQVVMSPLKKFSSEKGFYCDTGVPHLIVEVHEPGLFAGLTATLKKEASELRFHPDFSPKGTNVTYVFLEKDPQKLKAVSYERGVEDFTAACGTGAAAAAFYNLTKRNIQETEVEMPGGTLMMNLQDLERPKMTGPAVLLGSFDHEITI
jgi:diaminopimelate epimerase